MASLDRKGIQTYLSVNRPMIIHGSIEGLESEFKSDSELVDFIQQIRKGMVTHYPSFTQPEGEPIVTDVRVTPTYMGAISAAAMSRIGAERRTLHPTHSWIVNGPRSEMYIPGNMYAMTPLGMGCPLLKVTNFSGAEMIIGKNLDNTIVMLAAEENAQVPYALNADPVECTVIDSSGKPKVGRLVLRKPGSVSRNIERLKSFLLQEECMLEEPWGFMIQSRSAYERLTSRFRENPEWLIE